MGPFLAIVGDTWRQSKQQVVFLLLIGAMVLFSIAWVLLCRVQVTPDGTYVLTLAVGGSADAQRSRIQVFEEKILPVITEGDALFSESGANSARLSILALLSPALPLLVFIVLFAWLAWRGRLSRDQGYARRFYAKNKCLKALKEARASAEPSENLDVLLKVFIADMLNVNEAGLTSSDVEDLLKERRIAEDSIAMTVRVLRACERARYAGRNAGPEETEALCTATENVVEQLHAALQETQS